MDPLITLSLILFFFVFLIISVGKLIDRHEKSKAPKRISVATTGQHILNGKIYDLDTSRAIFQEYDEFGRGVWLYQSRNGNFFLVRNFLTETEARSGVNYEFKLIPLTMEEARNWLERIGANDILRSHFPLEAY